MTAGLTRQAVEDFLYHEAALLDAWKLDEWLALLTGDCVYRVPSNDAPEGDPSATLYLIADDLARIRGRVARLKDPHAHVEFPHSRTRRMISNVRILDRRGDELAVEANFAVHRFRRDERVSTFVGRYRYRLRVVDGIVKIASREAILDAEELGSLGAVSFIL
ncbi:MAG TPA: aromatic-ring-hydroxylating dioxygenase subunit beta [Usitatibacter sp.]|jgi:p-cumate 2,3-dioxygenase beta subunit|nr:aromatic-ring-hydroxylating dioxygenase subunit beta [Usitatibacter sp.]